MISKISKICFLFVVLLLYSCFTTKDEIREEEIGIESNDKSLVGELNLNPKLTKFREKRILEYKWRLDLSQEDYQKINLFETPIQIKSYLENEFQDSKIYQTYLNFLLVQKLAHFELSKKNYTEAALIWDQYIKYFPDKKNEIQNIITILKESEPNIFLKDLSEELGMNKSILPVPDMNGESIYFSSLGYLEGKGGLDIFESKFEGGLWSNVKALTSLNSTDDEMVSGVSVDGTELLITGRYKSTYGEEDIFASILTDKGWTNVRHFRQPINTEYYDFDAYKTSDGKAILFVSDRPGGYFDHQKKGEYSAGSYNGNTDIYISFKEESGAYGTPINLGPIINTPGSERTPFLHPDGKTLYYSTNGLDGFGDFDLYKTERLDDSWQNWTEPLHLGKQLNSFGPDYGFKMSILNENAFFSREFSGNGTIYQVNPLPKRAKSNSEFQIIQGTVADENKIWLQADIEWHDLETGEVLGKLSSKPNSGDYFIVFPTGREIAYYAKKKGFVNLSLSINLKTEKPKAVKNQDFNLISIGNAMGLGYEVALNNVFFETAKENLVEKSYYELDRIFQMMNDYPEIKIEFISYVVTNKTESQNIELSERRAEAMKSYFLKKGIQSKRIRTKGLGSNLSDIKEKANRSAYKLYFED
jgi:outer membrane protein OmpA-like peptidoglycan-associated protein